MDAVDISEHYEVSTADETPSLLSIIIDTNPRAWALLDDGALPLSLSTAVANLLVFVNAHLALSGANQVAVIAAHVNRAVWLYPSSSTSAAAASSASSASTQPSSADGADVRMHNASDANAADGADDNSNNEGTDAASARATSLSAAANKYPQFAQIEATVLASLKTLMAETTPRDLDSATTQLSGALTLALCHINKAAQALNASSDSTLLGTAPITTNTNTSSSQNNNTTTTSSQSPLGVKGRIVVLSVSDSEPAQYIATMNAVFAAAHDRVAIDTLALAGDATFLQQACFNTGGVFLRAAANPQGLLTYLLFGLVADTEARESLVAPAHDTVDFRAACFCHGSVVDTGFVCSICLSIFCGLPDGGGNGNSSNSNGTGAECLTCGSRLALGNYGAKPAVVPRKKRKKKKIVNGGGREETASATGTPRP